MSRYTADIAWALQDGEDFAAGRYSRGHVVRFDGGAQVDASASPHVVGKWAVAEAIDPEEMLVAAISSCHMLSFLHVARLTGFLVASYRDHAEGVMKNITPDRQAITRVVLRPAIEWTAGMPDAEALASLHHDAHEQCYIANSVTAEIVVAAPGSLSVA